MILNIILGHLFFIDFILLLVYFATQLKKLIEPENDAIYGKEVNEVRGSKWKKEFFIPMCKLLNILQGS